MKPKIIKLTQHEKVVAVVPSYAAGPGWANAPTWVHIVDYATGKHRCECIQPDERTPELDTLFHAGAAMHSALMGAVPTKIVKEKP